MKKLYRFRRLAIGLAVSSLLPNCLFAQENEASPADEVREILQDYTNSYQGTQFRYLVTEHRDRAKKSIVDGNLTWSKNGRKQIEYTYWYGARNSDDWEKGAFFQGDNFAIISHLSSDLGKKWSLTGFVPGGTIPDKPWWSHMYAANTCVTLCPNDPHYSLVDFVSAPVTKVKRDNGQTEYRWRDKVRGRFSIVIDNDEPKSVVSIRIEKDAFDVLRFGWRLGALKSFNGGRMKSLETNINNFQYQNTGDQRICVGWQIKSVFTNEQNVRQVNSFKFIAINVKPAQELNQNQILFAKAQLEDGQRCTVNENKSNKYQWMHNQVVSIVGDKILTLQGEQIPENNANNPGNPNADK